MAAPLKEKERLESSSSLLLRPQASVSKEAYPFIKINEAVDLYVRGRLEELYKPGSFVLGSRLTMLNQDFSPRAYFFRNEIEETTPHLNAGRERIKAALDTQEPKKNVELTAIFQSLLSTRHAKEIRSILENEKKEKVRKKALKILFLNEPEKEYQAFLSWLDEGSSKKIKQVIQTFFFERSALREVYPLLMTKQHLDTISGIRATEVIRCFFTDRPLFRSIMLNKSTFDQDELAPCDPLRHFFCRLLFGIYNAGLFPGGSGAKAMGEFIALQHLTRVNWPEIDKVLKTSASDKGQTVFEIINYDDALRPTIIKLGAECDSARGLERKLMELLVPSMCLLRYCTPSAWNIFDEEFRIRFKGLWTSPYWTRPEQNVDLEITIVSIGDYTVSQTKTYGVYPRLNPEDSSSTVIDLKRPYAFITFKITYSYLGFPKPAALGRFSILELKFTPEATPPIRKAITQALVNYNASEEAKLAAVVEPRSRFL